MRSTFYPAVLIVLVMLCACSGSDDPVTSPDISDQSPTIQADTTSPDLSRFVFGEWKINIDTVSKTADVTPDRTSQLHLNAVRLLEFFPCLDCLSVENITFLADDIVHADLVLRHPYPGASKLTAFDVRGIFISESDYLMPPSIGFAWGDTVPKMLNPDGYTLLFNPTLFPETDPPALGYIPGHFATGGDLSATLNPFVTYAIDHPRCMFTSGTTLSRTVELHVPVHPIEFGYAVDASWFPVEDVIDPVTDFPPEANCCEAYKILVEIDDPLGLPICGDRTISVEIFDHQGFDTIANVEVMAPDVLEEPVPLSFSLSTSDESWLFEGTISNDLGVENGVYPLIVTVEDTEQDPNLGTVNGYYLYPLNIYGGDTSENAWALTWGGNRSTIATAVTMDQNSNLYVGGYFQASTDFDPGPGEEWHSSKMGVQEYSIDGYVSRFDSDGNFQWVQVFGDTGNEAIYDIAFDGDNNIYVGGIYSNTVDFNPGPGEDFHTSEGLSDCFISKFAPNGTFQWARTWGGGVTDGIFGLDVDPAGRVYSTGLFQGTVDFDPGDGEDLHTVTGSADVFVSCIDTNGEFLWAGTFGSNSIDMGLNVEAAGAYGVLVTGTFTNTVDFDTGPDTDNRTSNGSSDAFAVAYSITGNYVNAYTWGGSLADSCDGISRDSEGNWFLTGRFSGTADLDPTFSNDLHTSNGASDGYLIKFNPTGGFIWAYHWGGISSEYPLRVTCDLDDNIYVTGYFNATADFDPGPGTDIHPCYGDDDVFIVKYHPVTGYIWARTFGGREADSPNSVVTDSLGNSYTVGKFMDDVDFNPGPGYSIHCASGADDSFMVKLPPDGNW